MGDPALYPEVRTARFLYAMQWLPPDFRADYQAAKRGNNGSTTISPVERLFTNIQASRPSRRTRWPMRSGCCPSSNAAMILW
eukprot:scaffold12452_cov113-Isochrysis_galbana.AAC.6